jgi:hypothetical protein
MNDEFVNPIDFGIMADKIYYFRSDIREKLNISIKELEDIGIKNGEILIKKMLIEPLLKVKKNYLFLI